MGDDAFNRNGWDFMDKIENKYSNSIFLENIKHVDEYGNEYWLARELQKVLEYKDWRNFKKVIDKAVLSANNSISSESDWVVEVDKPIKKLVKEKEEIVKDYKLSRYICYLIVQNADPSKQVVALGQTYFAIQTRKQEITEQEYDSLSDDEKRLYQRKLTKQGNYTLQKVALSAGVKNMAEFHNAGYKGLYNGETADDIFKRKKLRYREDILDNMNEDELVANLFRINQAKQKLLKDNVQGEKEAKDVHYEVGKKVRKAIADIGGMMPEDMPTPEKKVMKQRRLISRIERRSESNE
ncbi:MAG: DNA damage-inducible protein D [Clostridium sp.]|nr:MAG: DNA damage-inducible protein D [Clostridium sp.]